MFLVAAILLDKNVWFGQHRIKYFDTNFPQNSLPVLKSFTTTFAVFYLRSWRPWSEILEQITVQNRESWCLLFICLSFCQRLHFSTDRRRTAHSPSCSGWWVSFACALRVSVWGTAVIGINLRIHQHFKILRQTRQRIAFLVFNPQKPK